MKIINRKINELIKADYNPRKINDKDFEQLKNSLETFECVEPIVVNQQEGRENVIVGGHQRLKAMDSLGWKEVPTVEVNLPLEQEKELNVRLNRNTGEFDFKLLTDLFDTETLESLGFDLDELPEVLEDLTQGLTDPDDAPEVPKIPKTKLGDIYELGNHRLMCGDSTSINAFEKLLDGDMIDLLITDPPYNVAYEGKTKEALKIANDSLSDGDFNQFLTDVFSNVDAFLNLGASYYIFYADVETFNFSSSVQNVGWKLAQVLIWKKNSLVMGRKDYHFIHEPCLYGWKEGSAHNWYSDRKQTSVFEFDRPTRNKEHPTMKPTELIEYLLNNSSKKGDVVMDCFGGSGSTLIACEQNRMKCRTIEFDPKYCDVIVERWENFTGKKAKLLNQEVY